MERNFFSEGFEGFLREKADQYKLYPSDRVWKNIDRELRPRRKWPYLAAVLLLLGIGIGAKYYVSEKENGSLDKTAPAAGHISQPVPDLTVASLNPHASSGSASANSSVGHASSGHTRSNPLRVVAPVKEEVMPALPQDAEATIKNTLEILGEQQALPELRPQAPLIDIRPHAILKSPIAENTLKQEQYTVNPVVPPNAFTPKPHKWGFEMYIAPSVSFRRLTGKASNANYSSYGSVGYSANFGYPSDVNAAVVHRPSMGIELGSSLTYPISKTFRFKAGLQLNYSQYLIQAYNYVPEMASFGANNSGFFSTPINEVSVFRNFNGYSRTWLKNEHFMISMPIGFEMNLAGREDRVQFGITSTIQPTYVLNDNAFLISTNLKNYAEAPALYRSWNVNGAVGAFISVNTGPVKWILGPQFRYQMLSSYTDNYPIREHLVEYGFKIGIRKAIR